MTPLGICVIVLIQPDEDYVAIHQDLISTVIIATTHEYKQCQS